MWWLRVLGVCLLNLPVLAAAASGQYAQQPTPSNKGRIVMYVSTEGNDAWSGKLAQSNARHSDGPFATLAAARDAIRNLKAQGPLTRPVTVYVRGGTYTLAEPLVFTVADSGTEKTPISYTAYRGETPLLSGGRQITGWEKAGKGELWQAEVPGVRDGKWYFHQLFVNGERRQRARTPNAGFFRIDGGMIQEKPAKFKFHEGDIKQEWAGHEDVDLVLLQAWTVLRAHITKVNASARTVTLSEENAPNVQEEGAHYWIENSFDALDSPGEWYLDRRTGTLYYWPMPGEDMTRAEVIAPLLTELVRFQGDTRGDSRPGGFAFAFNPVHDIRLQGLTLSYADWSMPASGYTDAQGGFSLPAAVEASDATSIIIEDSVFKHLGQFAVELGKACKRNRIVGNEMADLGAGGVKIGEPKDPNNYDEVTSGNIVSDNRIHDVGVVDPGADAVWIGESSGNTIAHNEIFNAYHSGIAVGWTWGYLPTAAHSNLIEFNNIHHIGRGVLGDLGCVYLLGVQPGTVVRNNFCHDVTHSDTSYGGWGIYTDEGSSNIVIENNVVFRTQDAGFHQHLGQNNIIRNNIFALGETSQLRRTDEEAGHSFDFEHNIVVWESGTLLDQEWKDNNFHFDYNLYFYAGSGGSSAIRFGDLSFKEWQKRGQDIHSIIANPLFVDLQKGDFSLRPDSPALKIGFKAIDLSEVGPRGNYRRQQ
jgi:parallel beta-helix repeat protein